MEEVRNIMEDSSDWTGKKDRKRRGADRSRNANKDEVDEEGEEFHLCCMKGLIWQVDHMTWDHMTLNK